MTNVMHKFLIYFIYLFTSALHVSGFLLAHLQREEYNIGIGSRYPVAVVSARVLTPHPGDLNRCRSCTPASEDGLIERPKHVRQK
jgi:hypothetical protein